VADDTAADPIGVGRLPAFWTEAHFSWSTTRPEGIHERTAGRAVFVIFAVIAK
jgi:hypothetical protein